MPASHHDRRLRSLCPKGRRSTLSWARRVAEIIHSSDTITAQTAVIVLERNCKFEPLVHKLGRLKRTVKDIGELMNAVIKYAKSDKTKDTERQQNKAVQNKNGAKHPRIKISKPSGDLI